ncbi:hypothetical protein [Streptomyces sp. NPDC056144]|uniref:hypothetical protein n=1 Tax=unclassified Streptomyces TaxID=2593676 RepID=UPI0035D5BF06
MDYDKLDTALSAAVDAGDAGHVGPEGRDDTGGRAATGDQAATEDQAEGGTGSEVRNLLVTVLLEQPPTEAQRETLRDTGVDVGTADRTVVSGMLSRDGVDRLSHEPWVRSMTLSSTRRPL